MVLGLIFVSRMFLGVLLEAQGFLLGGGGVVPPWALILLVQYSTVLYKKIVIQIRVFVGLRITEATKIIKVDK